MTIFYNLAKEELDKKTRRRDIVKVRSVIIYIMENQQSTSRKELAIRLNITQSSISNILANSKKKEFLEDDINIIMKQL